MNTTELKEGTYEWYENQMLNKFDNFSAGYNISVLLTEAFYEISDEDFSKLFIEWCNFAEGLDIDEQQNMLNAVFPEHTTKKQDLPEQVTIYRAMDEREDKSKDYGIFWTLSKEVAEKFKDGLLINTNEGYKKGGRIIVEKTVSKEAIKHYNNHRKEEEVLVII